MATPVSLASPQLLPPVFPVSCSPILSRSFVLPVVSLPLSDNTNVSLGMGNAPTIFVFVKKNVLTSFVVCEIVCACLRWIRSCNRSNTSSDRFLVIPANAHNLRCRVHLSCRESGLVFVGGAKPRMKLVTIVWSKSEWVNVRKFMSNRVPTHRGAARIISNLVNEDYGHDYVRPRDITIHRVESTEFAN